MKQSEILDIIAFLVEAYKKYVTDNSVNLASWCRLEIRVWESYLEDLKLSPKQDSK